MFLYVVVVIDHRPRVVGRAMFCSSKRFPMANRSFPKLPNVAHMGEGGGGGHSFCA